VVKRSFLDEAALSHRSKWEKIWGVKIQGVTQNYLFGGLRSNLGGVSSKGRG